MIYVSIFVLFVGFALSSVGFLFELKEGTRLEMLVTSKIPPILMVIGLAGLLFTIALGN